MEMKTIVSWLITLAAIGVMWLIMRRKKVLNISEDNRITNVLGVEINTSDFVAIISALATWDATGKFSAGIAVFMALQAILVVIEPKK